MFKHATQDSSEITKKKKMNEDSLLAYPAGGKLHLCKSHYLIGIDINTTRGVITLSLSMQ